MLLIPALVSLFPKKEKNKQNQKHKAGITQSNYNFMLKGKNINKNKKNYDVYHKMKNENSVEICVS